MRFLAIPLLLLLSGVVTGCADSDSQDAQPVETVTVTEQPTTAASTSEPASPSPTVTQSPPEPEPQVGETYTANDVVVTVKEVEFVSGLGDETTPDTALEALALTCVPDTATAEYESTVFDFRAVTRDGLEIEPSTLLSGVREPAYQTLGSVRPGRCTEGWIQIFMTPEQASAVEAIEMFDYMSGTQITQWTLKR